MSVSIDPDLYVSHRVQSFLRRRVIDIIGLSLILVGGFLFLSVVSWTVSDPSYNTSSSGNALNFLGVAGAIIADLFMQLLGLSSAFLPLAFVSYGWLMVRKIPTGFTLKRSFYLFSTLCAFAFGLGFITPPEQWSLHVGLGGLLGEGLTYPIRALFGSPISAFIQILAGLIALSTILFVGPKVFGISFWGAILPDSVYGEKPPSADLHGMDVSEIISPDQMHISVDEQNEGIAPGFEQDKKMSALTYLRGATAHYIRHLPILLRGKKKVNFTEVDQYSNHDLSLIHI